MKLKELIDQLSADKLSNVDLDSYINNEFVDILLNSHSLKESLGLTPFQMESLYAEAYEHYMQGRISEASEVFRWLAIFDPHTTKYWLGHGATQQLLKEYEKALRSYAIFVVLDSSDPTPHFHAYECYIALEQPEEAQKALCDAYNRAILSPVYSELRQKIEVIRGTKW